MVTFRTRKQQPEVTIASTRIQNPNQLIRSRPSFSVTDQRAWTWYDRIGEVHFGLNNGARECSRANLMAVKWNSPDDFTEQSGYPQDLVMSLQSEHGGTPTLISRYYLNSKVTGDGYIYGFPEAPESPYMWFDFLSTDELQSSNAVDPNAPIWRVRQPEATGTTVDNKQVVNLNTDILIRLWNPHPRYSNVADSSLKALDLICEELDLLTQSLKAKITSRLAMAGILYIADRLQIVPTEPPNGDPNRLSEDPLMDYIIQMFTTAIMHPDEPSAIMPILLRGPQAEVDQLIKWIPLDREIFATDISQRDELIKRILHGLDLRPEQVEGFSESNHWSAWSTQDVHLKVDVTPDLVALCWALTKDFLWPQLLESPDFTDKANVRDYSLWFDLANLTVRPNRTEEFNQLAAGAAVSRAAQRAAASVQEEDAPDDIEEVRMIGWKTGDPYLFLWKNPEAEEIDFTKIKGASPPGPDPSTAPDSSVGPGNDRGAPGAGDSNAPRSEQPQ